MKIGFSGTGSTGKITLLRELQKDKRFKDYEFFDSITADAQKQGHTINEKGTDETQLAIMNIHKNNLKEDNFVAGRTALDCWCYSIYLYNHDQISQTTLEYLGIMYQALIEQYDILFYVKPEFKAEGNGLRSTNQSFINEVAAIFEEIIKRDNLPVVEIHGTVPERMKQIYEALNERS